MSQNLQDASSEIKSLSPRDTQKLLLGTVFVIILFYVLSTKWIPDLFFYWQRYNEKNKILKYVQTEGVKKIAASLQEAEKTNSESEYNSTSEAEPDFIPPVVLKRRTNNHETRTSTSSANTSVTASSNTNDSVEVPKPDRKHVRRTLPVLSPYAPPPVIQKTDEEIALEKSRKLKRQQDLAYQKSVEDDELKLKTEQALQQAREVKQARIDIIKSTLTKVRSFTSDEVTVKLCFRTAKTSASSKGTSKIRNGDILDNTVTLKNVMGTFATTDTVEYLLDYVEAHDSIINNNKQNNQTNENIDNMFELTLSYPNRVINRSLDPNITLADLSINADSVVWVTLL